MEARCKAVCQKDCKGNGDHGNCGGNHAQTHAVDDDGCRASLGAFGQLLCGLVGMGGVVFCDFADNYASYKAGDHGKGHLPPVGEAQHIEYAEGDQGNEHCGKVGAAAQGPKEVLQGSAFLGTDHVNT